MDLDLITVDDLELEPEDILPKILETGPLTEADLQRRIDNDFLGGTNKIQKVAARHHLVAQMMASGHKVSEISAITGYAPGTLSNLRKSPAFAGLLDGYMEETRQRLFDFDARYKFLTGIALDKLQDVLEEQKNLTPEFIMKIAFGLSDRIGYGPTQKVAGTMEHHLSGETLDRLKDRARALEAEHVVEAEVVAVESVNSG